jgi:hypothetical protein
MKGILTLFLFGALAANAKQILFSTDPSATMGGNPVSASALFTTSSGQLTIVLSNLLANETSDGQAISGLEFNLSQILAGTGTLTDTGTTVSVSNHVGTPDSTVVDAGWAFGTYNSENILCIICQSGLTPPDHTAPPSHLILGPGPYTNANGSITAHSPYMDQTVTFTINNSSITENTDISGVIFKFGTNFSDSTQTTGIPSDPGHSEAVTPEPGTLALAGIPALLLFAAARKKKSTRVWM